jgi:coproporphyrinogen III oxidase-like Fe-S oxidoreductase
MTSADGTTEEVPLSVWDRLRKSMHRLSREERMEEYMFLGLRMTDGISTTGFLSEFGQHLDSVYGKIIDKNIISGLMESVGGRVRLTGRGMDVSNVVLSDFLFDREETQTEDREPAENTSEAENEA